MNRSLLLLLSACLLTGVVFAQTTNSAPYCTPGYKEPAATTDLINSVIVSPGTFSNTSGLYNNSNYVYYNNLNPIVMARGTTYLVVVSGEQSTIGVTLAAWLDWNKDDSFDFFNEQMALNSVNFSPIWAEALSFTIPANADTGITRLRLIAYGTDNVVSIVACPTGGITTTSPERGETEDYRVRIVDPTGIGQLAISESIIYPNPASDVLNIVMDRVKYKGTPMVCLNDICGRHVLSTPLSADGKIDISVLPNGSYFLSFNARWLDRRSG